MSLPAPMQNSASAKATAKSILKPLYYRLPATVCYGPSSSPTFKLLQESQTWDEARLIDYQISKLRIMLRHCAAHVPYYKLLFHSFGFDPEKFRSLSDLAALPLLDKGDIRSNFEDLLADNIKPSRMIYFTTGGTMGKPLGLYNLRHSGGRERAFIYAKWARVGFNHKQRRAMLRGWAVKNKRHWKYEASERAFVFSNFHMTPENAAEYARVMRRESLPYLHSYPSAVIDFARRLKASHPSQNYPDQLTDPGNDVYAMVRECFHLLQLDQQNFGRCEWNPLGGLISPGQRVLIKPNFVLHFNAGGGPLHAVVTHPSVIRAIVDYVVIALQGWGAIVIGDAPQLNCDIDKLHQGTGMNHLATYLQGACNAKGFKFEMIDFRQEQTIYKHGIIWDRKRLGNGASPVRVSLGRESSMEAIGCRTLRSRIYACGQRCRRGRRCLKAMM